MNNRRIQGILLKTRRVTRPMTRTGERKGPTGGWVERSWDGAREQAGPAGLFLGLLIVVAVFLSAGLPQSLTQVREPGASFSRLSRPPADCPFPPSPLIKGLDFTGRHAEYTDADTWYPSWAPVDAGGVPALEATLRLQEGDLLGQAEVDLPEVTGPEIRRLLGHPLPVDPHAVPVAERRALPERRALGHDTRSRRHASRRSKASCS